MEQSRPLPRVAYSIDELASSMRVSRGFLNGEIKRGRLRIVKAGKRVLIPAEACAAYMQKLGEETEAAKSAA